MNFENYTLEELQSFLSDYHKDCHGFRPRGYGELWNNREFVIQEIEGLNNWMEMMKSTPAGREQLRREGWHIEEEDSSQDYDDSMDGDHASALASVGWGTDEDYGGCYDDVDYGWPGDEW